MQYFKRVEPCGQMDQIKIVFLILTLPGVDVV